ncbi:hypothetical protein BSKO_10048 [Bryopsis sp. KO-2023]|nr:hypothetical protein BSKO_10048 [Bryopsis sp. KO-2023]
MCVRVSIPDDFREAPKDVILDFGAVRQGAKGVIELHVESNRVQRLALILSDVPAPLSCENAIMERDKKGRAWWIARRDMPAVVRTTWEAGDCPLRGRLVFRMDDKRMVTAKVRGTIDGGLERQPVRQKKWSIQASYGGREGPSVQGDSRDRQAMISCMEKNTRIMMNTDVLRTEITRSMQSQGGQPIPEASKERLLLMLVQSIAAIYGVRVKNFTSDFRDGRVLCLLAHYYQPNIMDLGKVCMGTSPDASVVHRDEIQLNFDAVFSTLQQLGVPRTVAKSFFQLHREAMITFVGFVCSKMIEASWMAPKPVVNPTSHPLDLAATTIQRGVRSLLLHKKWERAAMVIQAHWHGRKTRKEFVKKKRSAVSIQAAWRGHHVRGSMLRLSRQWGVEAYKSIQRESGSHVPSPWDTLAFRFGFYWSTTLDPSSQCSYFDHMMYGKHMGELAMGEWRLMEMFRRLKATQAIQRAWRKLCRHRQAMAALQAAHFVRLKAVTVLQRTWRDVLIRKRHLQMHSAATVIQKHWRGCSARWIAIDMRVSSFLAKHLSMIHTASRTIQTAWRRHKARQALRREEGSDNQSSHCCAGGAGPNRDPRQHNGHELTSTQKRFRREMSQPER